MTKSRTIAGALSALAVGATGAIAAPAAAQAAEPFGTAATCYGGATSYTVDNNDVLGTFTTSTRCRDINLRVTRLTVSAYVDARTCFVTAGYCNDWRVITIGNSSLNEWKGVATDVLDGTRFNVEIRLNTTLTAYATVDLAY